MIMGMLGDFGTRYPCKPVPIPQTPRRRSPSPAHRTEGISLAGFRLALSLATKIEGVNFCI